MPTLPMAKLRRVSESFMPDTCQIIRPGTPVWGPSGETPGTPTTTTSKCRFGDAARVRGDEVDVRNQIVTRIYYTLVVPATTDITEKDQVVVPYPGGSTYEVQTAPKPGTYDADRQIQMVYITT